MNAQTVVFFSSPEGADAQFCSVNAALVELVRGEIFGLYFVRAVFHINHKIVIRHHVRIAGHRAHAKFGTGFVIAVAKAVADARAIGDVLN